MKKLVSFILVLAMAFTLFGCGSKGPEILGVYDTTLNLTEELIEVIDDEMMMDTSFGEYFENFELAIISEFNEDGTYKQYIDMDKLVASCDELEMAMLTFTEDAIVEVLKQELIALDPTLELNTKEDLEAYLGMTVDEMAQLMLGMDLAAFIELAMDESLDFDEIAGEALGEGKYKAEDGKLYMSDSLSEEINEEAYEIYTIKGDVVTITEGVNIELNEFYTYPIEMIKRAK